MRNVCFVVALAAYASATDTTSEEVCPCEHIQELETRVQLLKASQRRQNEEWLELLRSMKARLPQDEASSRPHDVAPMSTLTSATLLSQDQATAARRLSNPCALCENHNGAPYNGKPCKFVAQHNGCMDPTGIAFCSPAGSTYYTEVQQTCEITETPTEAPTQTPTEAPTQTFSSLQFSSLHTHVFPDGHTCPNLADGRPKRVLPVNNAGATVWKGNVDLDLPGEANLSLVSVARDWTTSEVQRFPAPFNIVHDASCSSLPKLKLPLSTSTVELEVTDTLIVNGVDVGAKLAQLR